MAKGARRALGVEWRLWMACEWSATKGKYRRSQCSIAVLGEATAPSHLGPF